MRSPDTGMTLRSFALPWCVVALLVAGCSSSNASGAKDITGFAIEGAAGTITGTSIAVTVPFGADVTNLTPTITITGASVSPASGVAQNFTNPVAYTVTAADGSTKAYTVTVAVAVSGDKDITAFTIGNATGTITGTSIAVAVPFGSDVTGLTPTISITGASVSPASGVSQDFTNPVSYTVTAADHSTKTYTVTVTPYSTLAISSFVLRAADNSALSADAVGFVGATHIAVALPNTFSFPASFTPTIASTGASVSPASGASQGFTASSNVDVSLPVTYTVTAGDGTTTKTYSVVLNKTNKNIILFSINGVDGTITTGGGGGGGTGTGSVTLHLPTGTDLHSLAPLIGFTGLSVNPASGVAQDFSQGPVTYTVTANDATHTTKTFTVTVDAP